MEQGRRRLFWKDRGRRGGEGREGEVDSMWDSKGVSEREAEAGRGRLCEEVSRLVNQ